jgi:hypothetical protein
MASSCGSIASPCSRTSIVPGETEHLDLIAGKVLFDDFFRDGADDLVPAIGAADALADLSTRAEVVILTNAPEHGRLARIKVAEDPRLRLFPDHQQRPQGSRRPPSWPRAPRVRAVFVDDLLPQLESVAEKGARASGGSRWSATSACVRTPPPPPTVTSALTNGPG